MRRWPLLPTLASAPCGCVRACLLARISHSPERSSTDPGWQAMRTASNLNGPKSGAQRRTNPYKLGSGIETSCQRSVARRGPQHSGSELLENLREQNLVRIAAGHAEPHFANGDVDQRCDFEQ